MKNSLNRRRKPVEKKEEEVPATQEELQPASDPGMGMMLDVTGLRMVSLYGDLDEKKATDIVCDLFAFHEMKDSIEEQLKKMDAKTRKQVLPQLAHKDPIKFLISTFGGNAVDMFGIYDCMRMVQDGGVEVHTVGSGKVMSAGVLLLAAGTKGKRTIGKNCRVMVHPVVGGAHGPSHDIQNEVEEILQTQKQYVECLANETKLSISRLNKLISEKRNIYLSASEAVKFGIADKIV
jgi:ATP-dependent Clp endopeptidase proteolytic subunit ClpP